MVDDDDGDDFPSPEPRTDSRSALPRKNMAWRRLRIVKRNESFSLIFSPQKRIYGVRVEVGGGPGAPQDRVARPLPRGPPGAPPTSTPTIYIHVQGEKNQGEGFIAFYYTEPSPPPVLPREGRSGVRLGLRRGGSSFFVITNPSPSPIP